ncbi:MAG: protein kinase [Candidatus Latescibacteria bacterium]|nr:protein kinase [Candidatus Latescibacterota bacterium]NIM64436.1 protein kinase [Candidatus Latescibacterota bacterium]NIO00590.1 protein kinase [Candidatus Latescibacterota bacterium]NIO26990.1 protein kinase [Candidatus Latescibacterota bacterium]NIO56067.1 protein kinase [Candidatus Latescibacterota bacterium]
MIGQTISHYRITEKLGEGGMGVVYKAEDTRLKRTVALKFLSPKLLANEPVKKRFLHEAQAAAGLTHPRICTIHEIHEADGHIFIVMEYIEGESLAEKIASGGPLPIEEALDIAVQVARGLAKAHSEGIVHRDIKPGNVLITPEGQAKVVDFGLAKLATQTRITRTGMAVGTVAYMSPEQAQGQEVDHRTDIWSLGAMLYEMLTGQLPFRGEAETAVLYSILNEAPEPVTSPRGDVPVAVEDIIEKALSKDPAKRHETTHELLAELETQREQITLGIKERRFRALRKLRRRKRLAAGIVAGAVVVLAIVLTQTFSGRDVAIDSVAVLPFDNLSGDAEQEYLSDGMTEALITELSKIGALRVISRTSAMLYKKADKPLPQMARELNVGAVVEGSVLRDGNRVRITAQLIGAEPERHLWADNYDRDFGDILILSSEVAQAIAHEIQVTLTPEEQVRLMSARPVNPEAHELYLRGKFHYFKYTKEELEKADDYFQQAIEIDPNYAQAYAGLAASIEFQAWAGHRPLEEAKTEIETLVRKALEIDDTIAEAYLALSGKRFFLDWDWLGGEEEMKRAIELNPGLSESHYEYAHYLAAMGRFEESIAEAKRALQLDPVSSLTNATLAFMYYFARQYDRSIKQYLQSTELAPNSARAYRALAWTYEATERYEDAVRAQQKAMTLQGNLEGNPPEKVAAEVAALDSAYSESGPRGYWRWHLESLKGQYDSTPTYAAQYYAQLGDKDQALAWLERAYEKHAGRLYLLKVSPSYDPLRDDPRFQDLLRRMNFPLDNEIQK